MAVDAVKPKLRGVLHQWAAVWALGAGAALAAMAPTGRIALAAGLYALSLVALFTISATYHRIQWSPEARARMRRADHASIFILIAGTYTPVALIGLPRDVGNSLFLAIWVAAGIGVLQSLFWVKAPKMVSALLAVAVGWLLVPYLGDVRRALDGATVLLLLIGGVAYTIGAIAYALKWPNPKPGVFGYHEVFHLLTLVGAATHFAAVVLIVRGQ